MKSASRSCSASTRRPASARTTSATKRTAGLRSRTWSLQRANPEPKPKPNPIPDPDLDPSASPGPKPHRNPNQVAAERKGSTRDGPRMADEDRNIADHISRKVPCTCRARAMHELWTCCACAVHLLCLCCARAVATSAHHPHHLAQAKFKGMDVDDEYDHDDVEIADDRRSKQSDAKRAKGEQAQQKRAERNQSLTAQKAEARF